MTPHLAVAYTYRADIYGLLKEYKQVIDDCKQALRLDPNLKEMNFNLAQAFELMGNKAEAINYYKIVLSEFPNVPETKKYRDKAQLRLQDDWKSNIEWF